MIRGDNYNPVNYNNHHPSAASGGAQGTGSPTKNFSGPPGGRASDGSGGDSSGGSGGGASVHKELISNNVQRKTSSSSTGGGHHNNNSSSTSLSFTSTQHLPNSHNNVEQLSTTSSAHAVAKGASQGDSVKEAKKSHDSNPSNSSTNNPNNNNPTSSSSSTYIYKDYANEEDITTKIINEYADRGSGVQGSIISHEDETTKNLMQQKLPAKLAAMLSDPGE
jgi:hypothetical protein